MVIPGGVAMPARRNAIPAQDMHGHSGVQARTTKTGSILSGGAAHRGRPVWELMVGLPYEIRFCT